MGDVLEREKTESKVDVILADGFGYGEGVISVENQIKSGELTRGSLSAAVEIVTHDPEVFVRVDTEANDDGCGDGRATSLIYRLLNPVTGVIERYKKSLRRAKIFGGGLVVASSMWRAVEGADDNKTLQGDREFLAGLLKQYNINHGAHTAAGHRDGTSCGCGAIDNYEAISRNATKYREHITGTLRAVYGDGCEENAAAIESVFATYSHLSESYFAGTDGAQTMRFIESQGAVIKELEGAHKEDMVIMNDVEGTTVDQELLRKKLVERGLSPETQAFVVDIWRGRMYADFIADRTAELGRDREESFKLAYADFLIRTLAVSATLTAGDQPVILRSAQN